MAWCGVCLLAILLLLLLLSCYLLNNLLEKQNDLIKQCQPVDDRSEFVALNGGFCRSFVATAVH